MSVPVARLRMFAGPNGAGKTTLKELVRRALPRHVLGIDLNPDVIESQLHTHGRLDTADYGLKRPNADAIAFFDQHPLLRSKGLADTARGLTWQDGVLNFSSVEINSYVASVAVAFLREHLIDQQVSFSIETVMSSRDKILLLDRAQRSGYRTYLYYVATRDPELNVARVAQRVAAGGHDVPLGKIVSRYWRSLERLAPAIAHTNRAFIFDNSGAQPQRLAEVVDGTSIHLDVHEGPSWFQEFVLNRLDVTGP